MEPAVDYNIYKSRFITGKKKRPTLNEFALSEKSMELMFKWFISFFEHKDTKGENPRKGCYYIYGDVDGFTFEVDWGVFHITVERYYRWDDLLNAPDEGFKVKEVWDTIYDCSRPCQAKRMNDYAKRNNL